MPTVRHPRALDDVRGLPPARVSVGGNTYPVEREGDTATVDLPERAVELLARAYGVDALALALTETCDVVKSDGEVCGRELPCAYHGGDD